MGLVYIFGPNEDENDYSSMGIIGALIPTECKFKEVTNGDSIVTLKHPMDFKFYRHSYLNRGNILAVPVPVRTTPEIENGTCVTTVWKYKVKPLSQLTASAQRTLYKTKTGTGKIKVMKANDVVTVVRKTAVEGDRWKVKSKYGTGWVDPFGLILVTEHVIADNSQAIEEIQSPWTVTTQYFRIYNSRAVLDSDGMSIQVSARHVRFDLMRNMTRFESKNSIALQAALDGVLNQCYNTHPFKAYTNVANVQAGLFYNLKNPVEAFSDPEEGLCKKYDVGMVSDNYDLYFLHDPGLNRGIWIEYRKNMTGIDFQSTDESVATRIIPIGENKDGTLLYLSDDPALRFVDSPKINDYPVKYTKDLTCDNCKVGDKDEDGSTITIEKARARMRQQAQDLIDGGCDQLEIGMSVSFINLGDTEEYKQFRNLENCFLFDYILVKHPELNINVTAQITEIEWDCLTDRMISVRIGTIGKTLANVGFATWQIPSGFSGSKIAPGTVGGGALGQDAITTRHLQADSINAGLIQAGAVVADKIQANAIEADKIKAGAITAGKIAADAVTTDNLQADSVTAGKIAAGSVNAGHIEAHTITADQIAVGTITAESGIIADGAIGRAHIADGSITNAQIADLSASKLTAGTIDAMDITVVHLNADNITVGTINGQRIAEGAIDTNHLVDGAISTTKIDLGAVTAEKLKLKKIAVF
jgi:phage minor structural protein